MPLSTSQIEILVEKLIVLRNVGCVLLKTSSRILILEIRKARWPMMMALCSIRIRGLCSIFFFSCVKVIQKPGHVRGC